MCGVKRGEAGGGCGKSRDDNGPGTKHVWDQKCVQNFVREKKTKIFVLLGCYAA